MKKGHTEKKKIQTEDIKISWRAKYTKRWKETKQICNTECFIYFTLAEFTVSKWIDPKFSSLIVLEEKCKTHTVNKTAHLKWLGQLQTKNTESITLLV